MGLLLSILISYAGIHEAIVFLKHILSGVVPDTQPDFQDLVDDYTRRLRKLANPSSHDWTNDCQGYLCLTEDKNGKLRSAAVKYYNQLADSTPILFSTKISSFDQESIEDTSIEKGDYKKIRYSPMKTKTVVSKASDTVNVGHRDRSPIANDKPNHFKDSSEDKENLTRSYNPQSPTQQPPEIHFQSYDDDKTGAYTEDYLRSLDGIKFRPLQRSDPSGRRRSFKKRHSSSSTSSRESRASREEELKMFTSLEEAEFELMNKGENFGGFGSAPNLSARSYSRSRSRERRDEGWNVEASVDSAADDDLKARTNDLPKLDSFQEHTKESTEVIEEEDEIDFWGTMGD